MSDASGGGLTFDGAGGVSASELASPTVRHPSSAVENLRLAADGTVEAYDGSEWVTLGAAGGSFNASVTITATDASWTVPTLADPIVRVTVIGGGGGGGASSKRPSGAGDSGANGSSSSVSDGTTTITAAGGSGGQGGGGNYGAATDTLDGLNAGNGGVGAASNEGTSSSGCSGTGGEMKIHYFDLTGISTLNITIGSGGAGGASWYSGGDGGDGVVIVEYRAA